MLGWFVFEMWVWGGGGGGFWGGGFWEARIPDTVAILLCDAQSVKQPSPISVLIGRLCLCAERNVPSLGLSAFSARLFSYFPPGV